jgi:hypothetical protein
MKKTLLLCTVMATMLFYSCRKEDALKDALDAGRISLNSESGEDLTDEEAFDLIYNFVEKVNDFPNSEHDKVSVPMSLFLMEAAFNNVFAKFNDDTKIMDRIDTVKFSLPVSNSLVDGAELIRGYLDIESELLNIREGEVVILADFILDSSSEYLANFEIIRHIGVSRVAVSAGPETCNAYAFDPRLNNPNLTTTCDPYSLYFLAIPPLRNTLSRPSITGFWTNIGEDIALDIYYANNQNFYWGHWMSCICWTDFVQHYQTAINNRFSVNPAPKKKVLNFHLDFRATQSGVDFEHFLRFQVGVPKVWPYQHLIFVRR